MCVVITMYNHIISHHNRSDQIWVIVAGCAPITMTAAGKLARVIGRYNYMHIILNFDVRLCCRSRFSQFIWAVGTFYNQLYAFDILKLVGIRTEWDRLQSQFIQFDLFTCINVNVVQTKSKIHFTFGFYVCCLCAACVFVYSLNHLINIKAGLVFFTNDYTQF